MPTVSLLLVALCGPTALAANHHVKGQVVDRNGDPVSRAVVSLSPGNVELITDREGNFLIDYLRDEDGQRTRLNKRTDYKLTIFKPGYHDYETEMYYKRGPLQVDTVTMIEETIDVSDFPENLDPALYSRPTNSAGATYEGQ